LAGEEVEDVEAKLVAGPAENKASAFSSAKADFKGKHTNCISQEELINAAGGFVGPLFYAGPAPAPPSQLRCKFAGSLNFSVLLLCAFRFFSPQRSLEACSGIWSRLVSAVVDERRLENNCWRFHMTICVPNSNLAYHFELFAAGDRILRWGKLLGFPAESLASCQT